MRNHGYRGNFFIFTLEELLIDHVKETKLRMLVENCQRNLIFIEFFDYFILKTRWLKKVAFQLVGYYRL